MATINSTVTALPIEQLADAVRSVYRDYFTRSVEQGQAQPLVLPYSLLGPFIIPTLWLAVPHVKRPWVYETRWLMLAFVAWFNLDIMSRTSSPNVAIGYASGLMAYWGMISTLGMCIWYRPQFEAARVVRKVKNEKPPMNGNSNGVAPEREGHAIDGNGLRQRKINGNAVSNGHVVKPDGEEYEHVWEPYPADAPFRERFNWAFDMTTNFRFAGWNCSIPCIPHPDLKTSLTQPIDMSTIPYSTRSGYARPTSRSSFLRNRLVTIAVHYLILDFLSVSMMKDPFFILGPDVPYPPTLLSPRLRNMSPTGLLLYRQLWSLMGVLSAIMAVFKLSDVVQYYTLGKLFPMRGELWQYSSTFGSFTQVPSRGLSGFWGSWWHQTFRAQFVAPAQWLVRHGFVTRGRLSGVLAMLVISFTQSGLLHGSGSITSVPATKPWRSPLFFILQIVGIAIQTSITTAGGKHMPSLPKVARMIGNLVFTVVWLHYTSTFFINDMASTGVWLLEPVPISLFRFLGYGHPGDHWWRWDSDYFPRWYSAEHWWQSGFAI